MKKMLLCASILSAASTSFGADLGLDDECNGNGTMVDSSWSEYDIQCNLPAEINVAGTIELNLENEDEETVLWALPEIVTVGNGHFGTATIATATDVTLKIEKGVEIVGLIKNSALIITRGAKIFANGTASDPIIFSSADADYQTEEEWGGVILSSFGTSNQCPATADCLMEGISSDESPVPYYYGGHGTLAETSASSGSMKYVVITEGGVEIVLGDQTGGGNDRWGNEINGLTLYGVNDETQLTNIHINDNFDDGIEFFGGDVNVSRLWLTCNADDSVDWDEGYTGTLNSVYILQGETGNQAFELASNASASGPNDPSPLPRANGSVIDASVVVSSGSSVVKAPFKVKEASLASFNNVTIDPRIVGQPCEDISENSGATFSNIKYSCDTATLPASSVSATGFNVASFWTAAQGNPYAHGKCE
jgi:hypothetical protein